MKNSIEIDQIVDTATRLFAELGYDGTSLGMIGDALGVPVSGIADEAGNKRQLYLTVMQRAFEAEWAALKTAADSCPPGRECVHHIADAYLDFHVSHPYIRALWAHRWVADAADIVDLEDRYPRPLFRMVAQKTRDAVPDRVNVYYMLGMMVWTVHGFLGSGVLARRRGMLRTDHPKVVSDFRTHLHLMLEGMMTSDQ
ncbi:TetR/AcrR family transcriptional regulator [Actinomadura miaoliensis]|uniref:HTH tetR-type domain-containing protein n=1 Tax=Actinomadura miaoliensis TaxID=430685 RepID=A0ABP7UYK9_9ACTN